ncbi:Uncharacterized protein FWK35_00020288 [Aphis craccivora]|uniref:Dimer Tnp hAT domain-containing protein n=1 Tax=Aphis craccivora TaxID=307492 RepID=A0A6G0XBV8_APHCR|nr:Uncharacterized protein FWK35_00020288 [Aphis craccivora]
MVHLKYAPVTSVDVERSFSSYKNILSDRHRSFLFENLKNHLIVQCNNNMCTGSVHFLVIKILALCWTSYFYKVVTLLYSLLKAIFILPSNNITRIKLITKYIFVTRYSWKRPVDLRLVYLLGYCPHFIDIFLELLLPLLDKLTTRLRDLSLFQFNNFGTGKQTH